MSNNAERLKTILEQARTARIAVLGDLMLDVYVSGSASRLSQEAPVPVLHVRRSEHRPGGAANVMRNLASMAPGCKVYAFGIIGNDADGVKLRAHLEQDGTITDHLIALDNRPTTVKQRVLAGSQQIVRMDFEETSPVEESVRTSLADDICRMIEGGELDAVILEDYAKGLLEHDMLQKIADTAAKHGVFVSLDPHPGHDMRVQGLSLMTPNRSEAFGLAGIYCGEPDPVVENDSALREVAAKLMDKWTPESLLVTLGHQGMALFKRSEPGAVWAIPTRAREVFDVSGAGDTVIATYTLCMAAGAAAEEAAEIANRAAGIVVGKAGTAVTNPEEMLASCQ